MKKKKLKVVAKKRSVRSARSYKLLADGDTNSFILVIAGGVFVIASLMFVFGNPFI